jgi:hypothetical protein
MKGFTSSAHTRYTAPIIYVLAFDLAANIAEAGVMASATVVSELASVSAPRFPCSPKPPYPNLASAGAADTSWQCSI